MKLVVQDFLRSSRLHELDTESGALAPVEGRERAESRGYFATLGKTPVVFYATGGKLHLRVGEALAPLPGAKVELTGEGLRTLKVSKDDQLLVSLQYPILRQPSDGARQLDGRGGGLRPRLVREQRLRQRAPPSAPAGQVGRVMSMSQVEDPKALLPAPPARRGILMILWGPHAFRKIVLEPGQSITIG